MARISDTIEKFIKNLLAEQNSNELLIQRNEIANKFNCAPSQINYVLTTRFTYEKGYVIESKRGGGGCIVIKKMIYEENTSTQLDNINKAIGECVTYSNALSIINHLQEINIISNGEYNIIKISINDRTLSSADNKNRIRADILRGMITVILS